MLTIGQVATRAGVRVDTVRYYERLGLVPKAVRRPSGYRAFSAHTVARIRFAKALQAIGLSLQQIGDMLVAIDRGRASCESERRHFVDTLARVETEIAALETTRGKLQAMLARCADGSCRAIGDVTGALR